MLGGGVMGARLGGLTLVSEDGEVVGLVVVRKEEEPRVRGGGWEEGIVGLLGGWVGIRFGRVGFGGGCAAS